MCVRELNNQRKSVKSFGGYIANQNIKKNTTAHFIEIIFSAISKLQAKDISSLKIIKLCVQPNNNKKKAEQRVCILQCSWVVEVYYSSNLPCTQISELYIINAVVRDRRHLYILILWLTASCYKHSTALQRYISLRVKLRQNQ